MEFLRRFLPRKPGKALEMSETIPLPIGFLLVGSLHSDVSDSKPVKSRLILPAAVTTLYLGQTYLIQIATLEPDRGLESVQFKSRREIKRGTSLTLPDGLLIAIPYPKFLIAEDGRVYYHNEYIESHEPAVEKERKINAVRQVIQYQQSYARYLAESATRQSPS